MNELDLDAARAERQVTKGIRFSSHLYIHSLPCSPLPHAHPSSFSYPSFAWKTPVLDFSQVYHVWDAWGLLRCFGNFFSKDAVGLKIIGNAYGFTMVEIILILFPYIVLIVREGFPSKMTF